ncbi:MAG: ABC transporter permease [Cetobacterium sp.]
MKWRNNRSLILFLLVGVIWKITSRLNMYSSYLLPSPEKVLKSLYFGLVSGELLKNILISLGRIGLGFSISFFLAFVLGIVFGRYKEKFQGYDGFIEVFKNIPPLSLIPLIILWFGIGETSKIIIIFLASFFPIFYNIKNGIEDCDIKLIEVGKSLGFSEREIFRKIILPNGVPSILLGAKIGLGYGFRAIIGAEMIAATSGMGYYILDAQQMSRSDKIICGIILIGIVGYLTDKFFDVFMKGILKGRNIQ